MGIAPIVDPVASRMPVDLTTCVLYAFVFALATKLAIRRPSLGVALLLATIPFDFARDAGPTTVTLAKVALFGLGVALLVRRSSLEVFRTAEARAVGAGTLAIFLATALSIRAAEHHAPAIRETLKALQYLALFATTAVAIRAERDDRPVRRALVLVTASVAALALAQLFTGAPSGVWFSNYAIPRIAGPLEGPNQLAGFLGVALPCVVSLVLGAGWNARERAVALATLALGGAALLLTLSRAGVLSSLAALGLTLALAKPEAPARKRAALAAVGGGLAAGVALLGFVAFALTRSIGVVHAVMDHFGNANEVAHAGGVGNRSILWHAAVTLWHEHPIFGVGAGNFELEIGRAGPAGVRTHANSLYLQALVEGGLPLVLATLGSVAATLVVLFRGSRRTHDTLVLGIACGLAGLAVHQIFDLLVFFPKVGDLVWVLSGIAVARLGVAHAAGRDVPTPRTLCCRPASTPPRETSTR